MCLGECVLARCRCWRCWRRSLRVLHFFNNMSGNGGAKAVATMIRASPFLEDLRFSSTRGGHEGGMELAGALSTLTTLRRLDLNDNTFGSEVGVALGRALERQVNIEVVNLGDTSTWCLCVSVPLSQPALLRLSVLPCTPSSLTSCMCITRQAWRTKARWQWQQVW